MSGYGVLCLLILGLAASSQAVKQPAGLKGKSIKEKWQAFFAHVKENPKLQKALEEHVKKFDQPPEKQSSSFQCNQAPSPTKPTSAHQVRPADINVVAATGDSITAAMGVGVTNVIDLVRNERGESWSIGGQGSLATNVVTMPNILKIINPNIAGFSFGEGAHDDPPAGLNVAIVANEARDMLEQAQILVNRMREPQQGVNWDNDWKLINMLVGANDLCQFCDDESFYSADAFVGHYRQMLDYLNSPQVQIPKTIVSISTIFDITNLPAFSSGFVCDAIQGFVCGCATEPENRAKLKQAQQDYHNGLAALINSGRYDTRPDFTVVMQPHFKLARPPTDPNTGRVDPSYWAIDCFHPGRKAHQAMGSSLWNNMLEPVGQKRELLDWSIAENLICPSESAPYIYTNLNSGQKVMRKMVKDGFLEAISKNFNRGNIGANDQQTEHVDNPVADQAFLVKHSAMMSDHRDPQQTPPGSIAAGVLAGLAVLSLVVVAVGYVTYRRRNKKNTETASPTETTEGQASSQP